jgi:hypothetical protein
MDFESVTGFRDVDPAGKMLDLAGRSLSGIIRNPDGLQQVQPVENKSHQALWSRWITLSSSAALGRVFTVKNTTAINAIKFRRSM